MGWLNTLLDVTSVAVSVANYNKLENLRKEGQSSQAITEILYILRQEAFNYRQSVEEIRLQEAQNPKVAAGAMRILENRLRESPITPDIFPDLSDKDYVATTTRLIQSESNRMMQQLPPAEQSEVNQAVQNSVTLSEATYYLENYEDAITLRAAQEDYHMLESRNKQPTKTGLGCAVVIMASIVLIIPFFQPNQALVPLILFGLILIGGGIGVRMYRQDGRYKKAKKTIEALDGTINLERFSRLERNYSGDPERASQFQRQAQDAIERFMNSSVAKTKKLPSNSVEAFPSSDGGGSRYQRDVTAEAKLATTANDDGPAGIQQEADAEPVDTKPEKSETTVAPVHSFCMFCGAKIPSRAQFCPSCGKKTGA